jgi:hypothetical protein
VIGHLAVSNPSTSTSAAQSTSLNTMTVIDRLEADNLSTSTSTPQLTFDSEQSLKQYLNSFYHNFEI